MEHQEQQQDHQLNQRLKNPDFKAICPLVLHLWILGLMMFVFWEDVIEECCTPSRERNEVLINAGLGKMKLVFPDKKAKHADVLSFLTEKFPRLKDGGGFEVLQAHGGGRWRVQSSSFCTTRERWLFPSLH